MCILQEAKMMATAAIMAIDKNFFIKFLILYGLYEQR